VPGEPLALEGNQLYVRAARWQGTQAVYTTQQVELRDGERRATIVRSGISESELA
jgi:hypothetical protein